MAVRRHEAGSDAPTSTIRRLPGRVRRKAVRILGGSEPVASAGAANATPRVRKELVRTQRELVRVNALLKHTRRELRAARSSIREAEYALPPEVEAVIHRVTDENLTYLRPSYLRDLATLVRAVESSKVPGLVIEAGTALGGSAIVMASAKAQDRAMKVYDVFGLIPPPTELDGSDVHGRYEKIVRGEAKGVGDDLYYGYRDGLYEEVTRSFVRLGVAPSEHRVELIKGLFEDTIHLDEPVAFAHLDGDWYESTMTCLTRIAPLLSPGGRIVLDDYYAWSGCRRAVDEYFAGREGYRLVKRAKLHVVRDGAPPVRADERA